MFWDLAVIEDSGNGGDLVLTRTDLAITNSISNFPYLAMFGGNLEANTETETSNKNLDFWGNNLFLRANQSQQFNSFTERILNKTPLTSAGRIIIQNAIKEDLLFMSPIGVVIVDVQITAPDRIDVTIQIAQNDANFSTLIINFVRIDNGDWYILDFNNDFN